MRYEVMLRGPRSAAYPLGEIRMVTVEAESGDDAAAQAFTPHMVVSSVQPAPKRKAKAN